MQNAEPLKRKQEWLAPGLEEPVRTGWTTDGWGGGERRGVFTVTAI